MAREEYDQTESLQNMTTRELRGYIYDKAREAQQRLDTMKLENQPRSVKDAASYIVGLNGKVKRSTSYMSKVEMVEYAYQLREFNMLDVTSGYAKDADYRANQQRYETFIKNRVEQGEDYWKKYLSKSDPSKVLKSGYKDYKNYINYLRAIETVKEQYGYRTLKEYAENVKPGQSKQRRRALISKMLLENYTSAQGQGLTEKQLIERFEKMLADYDEKHAKKPATKSGKLTKKIKKAAKKTAKGVKKGIKKGAKGINKGKQSKSNIKTATGRKMRTNGTVSERLT